MKDLFIAFVNALERFDKRPALILLAFSMGANVTIGWRYVAEVEDHKADLRSGTEKTEAAHSRADSAFTLAHKAEAARADILDTMLQQTKRELREEIIKKAN